MTTEELRRASALVVERLSPEHAVAYGLHLTGLGVGQIAARLGMTPAAVGSALDEVAVLLDRGGIDAGQ